MGREDTRSPTHAQRVQLRTASENGTKCDVYSGGGRGHPKGRKHKYRLSLEGNRINTGRKSEPFSGRENREQTKVEGIGKWLTHTAASGRQEIEANDGQT